MLIQLHARVGVCPRRRPFPCPCWCQCRFSSHENALEGPLRRVAAFPVFDYNPPIKSEPASFFLLC